MAERGPVTSEQLRAAAAGQPTRGQRPGDQPLPTPNDHPAIQGFVIADMRARLALGIERYGTPLQPHNGRDALRDLYEELLDACCYVRQLIYERDNPQPDDPSTEVTAS